MTTSSEGNCLSMNEGHSILLWALHYRNSMTRLKCIGFPLILWEKKRSQREQMVRLYDLQDQKLSNQCDCWSEVKCFRYSELWDEGWFCTAISWGRVCRQAGRWLTRKYGMCIDWYGITWHFFIVHMHAKPLQFVTYVKLLTPKVYVGRSSKIQTLKLWGLQQRKDSQVIKVAYLHLQLCMYINN